ncbi:PEP-CTERM sorting domain-containing protein [Pseudoduganella sp. OTU4001]|uniref:PEP-CTERM sorting domain-containing protein n=1 Tax=Pseudoduganella sp. OTU4001 TaxID=3043854 RepID=UPI00313AAE42
MKKLLLVLATALLAVSQSAHAGLIFTVHKFTESSVTFSLTGQMPTAVPQVDGSTTLDPGPAHLNLLYTGNLWAGAGNALVASSLSGDPFVGSGGLGEGWTGGWGDWGLAVNFTSMEMRSELTSLFGSGEQVTLSWDGTPLLNPLGTGTIALYWGSVAFGVDAAEMINVPFGATQVVNGAIQPAANEVPEPAGAALFGLGLLALGALRRNRHRA